MIYIYEDNGAIVTIRDVAPKTQHIALERMIPMPYQAGFRAVLYADFDTEKVWYELEDARMIDEKNSDIAVLRERAYKGESDNLYMAWQKYLTLGYFEKTEASKTAWLEKVSEINERYPYVQEQITE